MMQIYIDAISNSRIRNAEYVLQNSLQMERTCKKERVLELLKSGWDITGRFVNGTGYERYRIDDSLKIEILKNFLKEKFDIESDFGESVSLSFQEFYSYDCKSEGMNVDITFWNTENMQHNNIRIDGEKAKDIRDFLIFHLFVKQDKDNLMDLLKKELVIE